MASKRTKSKHKRINPTLWIFCEGKTEEAYINFLKQEYRIPSLQINPYLSGSNVTSKKIVNYKKGKPTDKKDKTYLMYDSDVESTLERLQKIENCTLILSNPCIELWFLLHCKNQTANITCKNLKKDLNNRFDYKKGVLNSKLKTKLSRKKMEAIKRAENLKQGENPSSEIYKLIKHLQLIKLKT